MNALYKILVLACLITSCQNDFDSQLINGYEEQEIIKGNGIKTVYRYYTSFENGKISKQKYLGRKIDYFDSGLPGLCSFYDEQGHIYKYRKFKYNDSEDVIEWSEGSVPGNLKLTRKHKYDLVKNTETIYFYDVLDNNQIKLYSLNINDSSGKNINSYFYNKDSILIANVSYKYDQENNLIESIKTDSINQMIEKLIKVYSDGKLISEEKTDSRHSLYKKLLKYDNHDLVIYEKFTCPNFNEEKQITYNNFNLEETISVTRKFKGDSMEYKNLTEIEYKNE